VKFNVILNKKRSRGGFAEGHLSHTEHYLYWHDGYNEHDAGESAMCRVRALFCRAEEILVPKKNLL
jgi:hypothetical protein